MNASYKPKIRSFLDLKKIAVLGYSRDKDQPANFIYKKLNDNGYKVFAVNPKPEEIKDVECYAELQLLPESAEGAVLCTPSKATEQAVKDCSDAGIRHIWMHQGIGPGSYDEKAFATAKELGMEVIPGACPMMFLKPDIFHKCLGWLKKLPE
jgi:hypothetical protein